MRHAHVPPELSAGPFLGSAARKRGLLTARQLAGGTWRRLLPDVYVHRDTDVTDQVRLAALALAVPADAVVTGRTAAWLRGAWRPRPQAAVPLDLQRLVGSSGSGLVGRGVTRRTCPLRVSAIDVDEVDGLLVSSPMRTCWDLASRRSLVEAVVVIDAFVFAGLIDLPTMAAYLDEWRGWPGVRVARTAVTLASPRVASPGETRTRMVVVLAGFPQPLVNVPLETQQGVWHPDLVLVDVPRPCGIEYDGAYHLDELVHRIDLRRENDVLAGGLPLLRYDGYSVLQEREAMVRQVARTTGSTPRQALDDRDFWRGPPARAW